MTVPRRRERMRLRQNVAANIRRAGVPEVAGAFAPYAPAPGVAPRTAGGEIPQALAMDAAETAVYSWAVQASLAYGEGQTFLGFPYLTQLAQRPEYRQISGIWAKEMTRRWIKVTSSGGSAGETKIKAIETALRKFKVRDAFRHATLLDGFFGRAHIYLDFGPGRDGELAKPLTLDPRKIRPGSLQGFRVIEPAWVYPNAYNTSSPLRPDYYRPREWFVMGDKVHRTRLLTFVSQEVPDLLKPAYSFGGLSRTQQAMPYVDNWIRTRQSVSDLLHSFSKTILKTNLTAILSGGGADDLNERAAVYAATRDNKDLIMVDFDTEDVVDVSTPLGTLDKLQAQSQEQMASIAGIPLVVLLGITPSGLNASSDGEIKTFYAAVKAAQEDLFTDPLNVVLAVLQLHLFGAVDPDIGFEFLPLWEDDETTRTGVQKTKAEIDTAYLDAGVVSAEEVRERLANDPESPYAGLDLSAPPPDPPEDDVPDDSGDDEPPAQDKAWEEDEHPRAPDGKFGSGGGGASPGPKKAAPEPKTAGKAATPAGRTDKFIPPHEFNATHYAKLHDKFDVTEADIIDGFPDDTAGRLKSCQARVNETTPTIDAHRDALGNWTPERAALHQEIISRLFTEEAVARARPENGAAPTFTVLGGRGGSGKSKLAGLVYDPERAIVLDPGHIKAQLPEYEGWNAAQVHEESSEIADEVTRQALAAGLNLVHDATLKSPDKAKRLVEGFKANGYRVEAHYMHLPRQEAAKRAVHRFLRAGRYVPPAVVLDNTRNEESFEGIKGLVDAWSFRDNNVPEGHPPVLISESRE